MFFDEDKLFIFKRPFSMFIVPRTCVRCMGVRKGMWKEFSSLRLKIRRHFLALRVSLSTFTHINSQFISFSLFTLSKLSPQELSLKNSQSFLVSRILRTLPFFSPLINKGKKSYIRFFSSGFYFFLKPNPDWTYISKCMKPLHLVSCTKP